MDGRTLVLVGLGLLVVLVDTVTLLDLRRNDVTSGPKWVWVLLVVFSFPLGAILYFAVGRRPAAERPAAGPATGVGTAPAPHPGDRVETGGPRIGLAEPGTPWPPAVAETVVRTTGLRKVYDEVIALDAVDLHVPHGAIYGLVGPNGAGKTTLLGVLTGLRDASGGTVAITTDRRRIAVLPDTPLFEPWLTAAEVVDLARSLQRPDLPRARVGVALARTGLAEAADRRVGGFSRGMLQRVGLAACLVVEPELYFLDEPSSALDPAGRREVLDLIGRLAGDATVVLSTHILSDVQQVCDTVGVLVGGRLRYEGPLADLLARTVAAFQVVVRPPAGEVVEALRASDLVESVTEQAPGQLRIVVTDTGAAERTLPGLLAASGARLVAFNPATDLETAFLELTT